MCDKPYLALSFGKDSLVMLDLVRSVRPDINCIFLESEESRLLYDYDRVISLYLKDGLNLTTVKTNRLSENETWTAARKAGNADFFLSEFEGWDGVFMGLRIEESKSRKYSLIKKENNEISDKIMVYRTGPRKGMLRCCPMAYWTAFEVLFYLKEKNLPYLNVYDNGHFIRTTARLTGDAERNNALHWIKQTDISRYNKIVSMIPELKYFRR